MSLNLAYILRESAKTYPDKPALIFDGGQITYGQLDALSDQFARGLQAAGFAARRPDRAAAAEHPAVRHRLLRHPQGRLRRRADERAAQGPRGRASSSATRTPRRSSPGAGIGGRGGQGDRRGRGRAPLRRQHAGRSPRRRSARGSSRCMAADPTSPAPLEQPRPGRHRGDHLHLGHHGHAQGRRAHALPAVHELRHPGPGVRHPRRRRHPRRAAAVPRVRPVQPAQRRHPFRRHAVAGPAVRGGARCSRSSSATRATLFAGVPTMFLALLRPPGREPGRRRVAARGHLRRRGPPGRGARRVREAVRRRSSSRATA